MPDFTEQGNSTSTTWTDPGNSTTAWADANRDPKKRYGKGLYGVGRYGQGYVSTFLPDFTEQP